MNPSLYLCCIILLFCRTGMCDRQHGLVDSDTVRAACQLLIDNHIQQEHIKSKEVSREWAQQFMLTLDPHRMHFLATDVAELNKYADTLFEDALQGETEFAQISSQRFLSRLSANTKLIFNLLSTDHDFTINESVQTKHDTWAAQKSDSGERWRLRIKYELLLENPDNSNAKSSCKFLRERYSRVHSHFSSLTHSMYLSLYIDALARTLDPHSAYMDERYLTMFRTSHFPNYTLGLPLTYRDSDLWILPSAHLPPDSRASLFSRTSMVGCRIVAIQKPGDKTIHLTGLTKDFAIRTIVSSVGEPGNADSVLLELDDPLLRKRFTVSSDRWRPQ